MDVTKITITVERTRGGKISMRKVSSNLPPLNKHQREELAEIVLALAKACAPRIPKKAQDA